jgi:hypothetical protein
MMKKAFHEVTDGERLSATQQYYRKGKKFISRIHVHTSEDKLSCPMLLICCTGNGDSWALVSFVSRLDMY